MAGKVTVVGAGFYGSTTAQRIAEYDIGPRRVSRSHHPCRISHREKMCQARFLLLLVLQDLEARL